VRVRVVSCACAFEKDCAGISPNLTRQLAKNDACVHTLDLSGVKLQSIFSTQKSKEATYMIDDDADADDADDDEEHHTREFMEC
jgi:hypothetical protein